jgi:glycosyltransferase involved in cell wall biosynthesis
MRGILNAAEEVLPQVFSRVEVWSMENELEDRNLPWLTGRKFPKISPFWPIQCTAFRTMAWRMFRKLPKDKLDSTLTFCSGEHLPEVDVRYLQFWNITQKSLSASKPELFPTGLKERIFRDVAIVGERQALRPGSTGEWWCVSRGIAEPIRNHAPAGSIFRYLPNTYDPKRFNAAIRKRKRAEMRASYGFDETEIVLVFCSFGHFLRKGLLQAVATVNGLRELGHPVRLLVLGGTQRAISEFRQRIKRERLGLEATVFAGMVTPPENHLSAGDAFLFPSHFEAFSLVEIEAAALGLRLYLTAHPGSEMILREGVNGRLLPWEIAGMIRVLDEEIRSGTLHQPHSEMGEALVPAAYAQQLSTFFQWAIENKNAKVAGEN